MTQLESHIPAQDSVLVTAALSSLYKLSKDLKAL